MQYRNDIYLYMYFQIQDFMGLFILHLCTMITIIAPQLYIMFISEHDSSVITFNQWLSADAPHWSGQIDHLRQYCF